MLTGPTALRLLAVAALTLLAGCGGGSGHNDADVDFAQGMIPHHVQALDMASMALSKSSDPEVVGLAEDIRAAQDPEIATMTGWLEEWDEEVPSVGETGDHGDHGGHDMPGMMTSEDMDALAQATGPAFDRLWLEQMLRHHEGAVEMAQAEQSDGSYDAAVELAEEIESTQRGEIAEMEALLEG